MQPLSQEGLFRSPLKIGVNAEDQPVTVRVIDARNQAPRQAASVRVAGHPVLLALGRQPAIENLRERWVEVGLPQWLIPQEPFGPDLPGMR